MFALQLNRMTERTEHLAIVAVSDNKQKLLDWMISQLSEEPYTDEVCDRKRHKVFKKSGPLEWYDKPYSDLTTFDGSFAIMEIPSREEHTERMKNQAAKEYDSLMSKVALV